MPKFRLRAHEMKKTFCVFGLASLLAAGTVVPGFAASDDASQATTGTQTGSQQVGCLRRVADRL